MKVCVKMDSSASSDCEVWAVIKFLNVEGFCHPTYLPNLALSDYHLIPSLKCDSGGRHFATEDDLQSVVAKFLAKQDAEWYSAGIYKLILRYDKCLNEQGDYVESGKFRDESNKCCFEALSFLYRFCEQCYLTFETFYVHSLFGACGQEVVRPNSSSRTYYL